MRMNREKREDAFRSNDAFYLHEQAWSGSSFSTISLTFQPMAHAPFSQLWPALYEACRLVGGRGTEGWQRADAGGIASYSLVTPRPPADKAQKLQRNLAGSEMQGGGELSGDGSALARLLLCYQLWKKVRSWDEERDSSGGISGESELGAFEGGETGQR